MKEVKEKFRNVTFNVSESLIEEIDVFCKKRGFSKRKEWLFHLIKSNNSFKSILDDTADELRESKNNFQNISSDYLELFKENEHLKQKIEEKQLAYSNLFISTLRYRTFYRRLKNLFSKF
jgi:metal-responsive CopG/Arc/MetJ family transcriptional regulator